MHDECFHDYIGQALDEGVMCLNHPALVCPLVVRCHIVLPRLFDTVECCLLLPFDDGACDSCNTL